MYNPRKFPLILADFAPALKQGRGFGVKTIKNSNMKNLDEKVANLVEDSERTRKEIKKTLTDLSEAKRAVKKFFAEKIHKNLKPIPKQQKAWAKCGKECQEATKKLLK